MNERWKIIPEFPDYSVSSLGRIRKGSGQVMKTFMISGGLTIHLSKDRVVSSVRVSRLVGAAFSTVYRRNLYASYRNGDRTDCRPCNLKWGNRQSVTKAPFTRTDRKAAA